MRHATVRTIDEYIAQFDGDIRERLMSMRKVIRDAAPAAAETISYGMPTFVLSGNLVHFAGYKKHIGFYPTPSGITAFEKALSQYPTSKGAVQFPHDRTLPLTLVRRIVEYRVNQQSTKV